MGVKSVLKKVGKIGLKVAPYAAMAIPGVGPLASMAIAGGTSALSKKLEGGSWKDAALAGGIGAGTSLALGKIPIKGLGPSSPTSYVKDAVAKTASKSLGNSTKNVLGNVLSSVVTKGQNTTGGYKGALEGMMNNPMMNASSSDSPNMPNRTPPINESDLYNQSNQVAPRNGMMRGLGPVMGRMDQNNPNLAESIGAGRQNAMRNQPFRGGYDVNYLGSDDETPYVAHMPSIFPNTRNRKLNQNQVSQ